MFLRNAVRSTLLAVLMCVVIPASAQERSNTLKKIKETGTVTLGHREAAIPFSYTYYDSAPKIGGYTIDLCLKVIEELKTELKMPDLKVVFKPLKPSTRIPLVSDGTVDIECGASTNTAVRQRYVAFSTTFFIASVRLVSKASANIKTTQDLTHFKTVASTDGSSGSRLMSHFNISKKGAGATLVSAKDHADGFQMVESDQAMAFANDDVLLHGLISTSKSPDSYVISEDALSVEPYGLMILKDDKPFKEIVDRAIRKTYESGEIDAIYKKWFQSPIPPRGVTLNIPPSQELRRLFMRPTDSSDPKDYQYR